MPEKGLKVAKVISGSIAEELKIKLGDQIKEINGQLVKDILDYRFLICDESLQIKVMTAGGEEWELDIEKDFDEDLGIDFGDNAFGHTRLCQNNCIFCFVDQMALNMRKSLYVKDDDYRMSFWYGNFITLTNVREEELNRIIRMRLSPLYISVHTTNPVLRVQMMRNKNAGQIMNQLTTLAEAGIEMNTQIVLCPEQNDGEELTRTVNDLASLWPQVQSVAVVPVGITKFRENLFPLRNFTKEESQKVLQQIDQWQKKFQKEFNDPFVFASDEFYVVAGEDIPPDELYGSYPQIENGIGMARLFLNNWDEIKNDLPQEVTPPRKITLATGSSAKVIMMPMIKTLNKIKGLELVLREIPNLFFGKEVTVAGLITGSDLLTELKGQDLGGKLIIPSVMLKNQEEEIFIDDITLEQLEEELEVSVWPARNPRDILEIVLDD